MPFANSSNMVDISSLSHSAMGLAQSTLTLGAIDWKQLGTGAALVMFMVACIFLILTVLVQKPQGGGLAGAFGSGAGSGQTAFGAKTGDALTVATIVMFVFYLLMAIALTFVIRPSVAAPAAPEVKDGTKQSDSQPAGSAPADANPATPVPAQTPPGAAPAAPPVTPPASTVPPATPAPAPASAPAGELAPAPKPGSEPAPAPVPAPAPAPADAPKP